jgi:hypothetical protein
MTMYKDYIPKGDLALGVFARRLYDYAKANASRWGVSSPEGSLKEPLEVFEAALEICKDSNHGKNDSFNKNEAKKNLVSKLRLYVQGMVIRNSNVTNADKICMALPLRDAKPTPHPVPTVQPYVDAHSIGRGGHKVTAMNSETSSKSKPLYVASVAFASRARMPDDPVSQAETMPSTVQTSAEKIFSYKSFEYGFVVDYAVAYLNSTGKQGPWSEVVSLVITK